MLRLIALILLMCTWRDNDPNDAKKGRTKVQDCMRCDCSDSTTQHNYYHGECIGCGRKQ